MAKKGAAQPTRVSLSAKRSTKRSTKRSRNNDNEEEEEEEEGISVLPNRSAGKRVRIVEPENGGEDDETVLEKSGLTDVCSKLCVLLEKLSENDSEALGASKRALEEITERQMALSRNASKKSPKTILPFIRMPQRRSLENPTRVSWKI